VPGLPFESCGYLPAAECGRLRCLEPGEKLSLGAIQWRSGTAMSLFELLQAQFDGFRCLELILMEVSGNAGARETLRVDLGHGVHWG